MAAEKLRLTKTDFEKPNFGSISESQVESEDESPGLSDGGCCKCTCFQRIPKRYIVGMMTMFGTCLIYSLRASLNVAIVPMVANKTREVNGTTETYKEFDFSTKTEGIILASFYYGYTAAQLPGGYLSTRFGGRIVFGCGVFFASLFCLLIPPALYLGLGAAGLMTLRIAQGLAEGMIVPASNVILSVWFPSSERGRAAALVFSGLGFGPFVFTSVAGLIITYINWRAIFYLLGGITMSWVLAWFGIIAEKPSTHPTIKASERDHILQDTNINSGERTQRIPWLTIITSMPFWATAASLFACDWMLYSILTLMPTFLRDISKMRMYWVGFIAGLTQLITAASMLAGGALADLAALRGFTPLYIRKLIISGGLVAAAALVLFTAYNPSSMVAVVLLVSAAGMGGFSSSGVFHNEIELSPPFASIISSICNTITTPTGIISPTIEGYLVTNRSPEQWRYMFYITASVCVAAAVMFMIFGTTNRQNWSEESSDIEERKTLTEGFSDTDERKTLTED